MEEFVQKSKSILYFIVNSLTLCRMKSPGYRSSSPQAFTCFMLLCHGFQSFFPWQVPRLQNDQFSRKSLYLFLFLMWLLSVLELPPSSKHIGLSFWSTSQNWLIPQCLTYKAYNSSTPFLLFSLMT